MRVPSLTIIASLSLIFFLVSTDGRSRPSSHGLLVIANQKEHTALVVDPESGKELAKIVVGVNGHEVTVSGDGRYAYVPIYGNSGVGKPGTDGSTIDVIDLQQRKLSATIDLGKPLRPHAPHFAPDGTLYVSAELANSIDAVDTANKKVLAENPTGEPESHMFVLTPDGARAYTANVSTGTVSVVDITGHRLMTTIPVSKSVQRISISPDGRYVFTHDQTAPRIAVIDTSTNKISNWIDVPDVVYGSAVTPDGQKLIAVCPATNRALVIDIAARKVVKSYETPRLPGEVLIRPDGRVAFMSCMPAGKIAVLDLRSWELKPSIDLTPGVDGMAWATN